MSGRATFTGLSAETVLVLSIFAGSSAAKPQSYQCENGTPIAREASRSAFQGGEDDGASRAYEEAATCVTAPGYFDYGPHRDHVLAEALAMEISGELRARDAEYDRIVRDLDLMVSAYPVLGTVDGRLKQDPYELLVRVDPALSRDGFDTLNVFYQVIDIYEFRHVPGLMLLTFCDSINAPVLAGVYELFPEVMYAEPSWSGGDGDWIRVAVDGNTYVYEMENGEGDCIAGCMVRQRWTVEVTLEGVVRVVSYSPGPCGAGLPNDGDMDGDGVIDCQDPCPLQPDPNPVDSDGDGFRDSCDNCTLFNPEQKDCQRNGVGDLCELTQGSSADCNGNSIPDECDIAFCGGGPSCRDCNGNGIPDGCDLASGSSADSNGNGVPDECDPLPPPMAASQTSNPRILSFGASTSESPVSASPASGAIRVTLTFLPGTYASWMGQRMWVGPPVEVCESSGVGPGGACPTGASTSRFAELQCARHCRTDWNALGTIHISGEAVIPGATYRVQIIDCLDDPENEALYSEPLTIGTARWGDCCGRFNGGSFPGPDNRVEIVADVVAILEKFANGPGAPGKARCDMEPATLDFRINITDVTRALDAFRGWGYPFARTAPTPCG